MRTIAILLLTVGVAFLIARVSITMISDFKKQVDAQAYQREQIYKGIEPKQQGLGE
jgi:signal recognition particle GTPase